jgi:hypothetical protein
MPLVAAAGTLVGRRGRFVTCLTKAWGWRGLFMVSRGVARNET